MPSEISCKFWTPPMLFLARRYTHDSHAQDEGEQLAMCIFGPGQQRPVYVSVWLALDNCDLAKGCLEVTPPNVHQP